MKKEYTYIVLSIMILVLGVVFTISGALLQTLPYSSKSALLIFSCAFIVIGIVSFAVHHKKYTTIKNLLLRTSPVIAHWTYPPGSSKTIQKGLLEQKHNSLATSLLILILSLIFSIVFAYSGGTYVLYLGYVFAVLCLLTFIIVVRFISAYYDQLSKSEATVLFGEDSIYFLDELYPLKRTFYLIENVNIYIGTENLLIFEFGLYDIDEPAAYQLAIPIPPNKLSIAMHLKDYYRSTLHSDY